MPKRACLEVRDESGEVIEIRDAQIDGGSVSVQLPVYEVGKMGSMVIRTDIPGEFYEVTDGVEQLPTEFCIYSVQSG